MDIRYHRAVGFPRVEPRTPEDIGAQARGGGQSRPFADNHHDQVRPKDFAEVILNSDSCVADKDRGFQNAIAATKVSPYGAEQTRSVLFDRRAGETVTDANHHGGESAGDPGPQQL